MEDTLMHEAEHRHPLAPDIRQGITQADLNQAVKAAVAVGRKEGITVALVALKNLGLIGYSHVRALQDLGAPIAISRWDWDEDENDDEEEPD
jgi:hypothetical protein